MTLKYWLNLSTLRRAQIVAALLALVTIVLYSPVAGFDFTNFDDPFYIYQNPIVNRGLTANGLFWGLTTRYFDFWHPLTWWSHMLDCTLFGLNPGGHHLI